MPAIHSQSENALAQDLSHTPALPNATLRFVVRNEFEALLFRDCVTFASGINRPDPSADFQRIHDGFATPENINDSPMTATSKRVEALIPGNEKLRWECWQHWKLG